MAVTKYNKPLYGRVHVYDYEHSGDSRQAYNILRRFGITDTSFENNGDGNVAFIDFTMEFNEVKTLYQLTDALEGAGYGCGFINLYEYVGTKYKEVIKALNILPLTDKSLESFITAVPFGKDVDIESDKDWVCYAEWKMYRSTLKREPELLAETLKWFKKLGATEVGYSEGDIDIVIRANVSFKRIKEYKYALTWDSINKTCFLLWRGSNDWRDDSYSVYGLKYMMIKGKGGWRFFREIQALGGLS